jgi:catecholate siderophore receptor
VVFQNCGYAPALREIARASGCVTLAMGMFGAAAHAEESAANAPIVVVGTTSTTPPENDKIATDIVDTPQSISRVSRDEMDRRAVSNLNDALRSVAGISLGAGETSWQGNNLVLRGFTTRNDTYLDQMRDYGYFYRDPFALETVEVYTGPGSALFGRGATGGVIAQVSKQPGSEASERVEAALGTDDTRRYTLDLNQPLGSGMAARVEAMRHVGAVADRDGGRNARWGVAPSLAMGMGSDLALVVNWLHQEEDNRPDYGIPWFNGAPAPVDRSNFYGFADDYLNTRVNVVTAALTALPGGAITVHQRLRYSHDTRAFRTSEAVIPPGTAATVDPATVTVGRNEFSGFSTDRFFQSQTNLSAALTTGALRHQLAAGVELGWENPQPSYIFHVGVIGTNLANPQPQAFAETAQYLRLRAVTTARTQGAYLRDTVEWGDHWLAVGGLRWDRFSVDYRSTGFNPDGTVLQTTRLVRTDRRLSGNASLVYKPDARSSLYASWSTSFNPTADGIESLISSGRTVAEANVNAAPETARMFELGAKTAAFSGQLLLTLAAFDTVKANARVPSGTVSGQNINVGRQRVRGIEFEAAGQIGKRLDLKANFAVLDSATLAVDNAALGGSPRLDTMLTLTPRFSANIQADYAITPRLGIGAGLTHQSSRLAQNTVSSLLSARGYTVAEARLRYALPRGFSLQANIYNIGNVLYYDQLHPFHVVPGAGRSALFTLTWTR